MRHPSTSLLLLITAILCVMVDARFESLTDNDRSVFAAADAARAEEALARQRQQRKQQGGECEADGSCKASSSTSYPHQHYHNHQTAPPNAVNENDDDDDDNDDQGCFDSIGTEACLEMVDLIEETSVNRTCIRLFGAMRDQCRKTCHLCGDYHYGDDEEEGLATLYSDIPQRFLDPREEREPTEEEVSRFWELLEDVDQYMFEGVYVNEDNHYENLRFSCRNRNEACIAWAVQGECEANPGYMKTNCAPACRSCAYLDFETRCPFDRVAPVAWNPGDIHRMFTRIVQNPDYQTAHNPTILSQPNPQAPGILNGPWVITLDNFLNATECQTLIELGAKEGYERSEDVGEMQFDGTYGSVQSEGRTSTNAWCNDDCWKHPVAQDVHRRMGELLQIPPENYEYLQLLKYEEGQFYEEHHDFIEHDVERQPGPRILTVFFYLNDLEEHQGGGTNFPRLQNLTVTPKQGRALLWPSVLDLNPMRMDPRTHHQALPVLGEDTVKYGANAWVHQRDFKTPHDAGCT